MDPVLAVIGLAKLAFGVFVGVVGISVAARLAARLSGFDRIGDGLRAGNIAVGVAVAGSIAAMGIMVQHAVSGTFGALDLLLHTSGSVQGQGFGAAWVFLYAFVHVVAALGVGAGIVVIGTRTFVRLTPDVDEIAEIRGGNVASALVLASVLIVMALLAQQGMETLLDGLLPLPTLGRDALLAPN